MSKTSVKAIGYSASHLHKKLVPSAFVREAPGANDLQLDLLYCGVCHSDVHQVNNDWLNTVWPCVPGHEIVGRVAAVGSQVKSFKVGDLAAVGCMIDSCGTCPSCTEGNEQYCESETSWLATYNGAMNPNGQNTYGGYSSTLVLKEHFALKIPEGLDPKVAGPILCAGVTTYSPLKHWKIGPGMKVGIIGFGGLGHMAVQIAKALGATVTAISTTEEKAADAKRLGASEFLLSTDQDAMNGKEAHFDFLLSTIPDKHSIDPYVKLLKRDGRLVIVGVLVPQPGWNPLEFIMHRRSLGGSLIGSIRETQEVLDFCAAHRIAPEVEMISIDRINEAYGNIEKKKVRYRYVIDLATLEANVKDDAKMLEAVTHRLLPMPAAKDKTIVEKIQSVFT